MMNALRVALPLLLVVGTAQAQMTGDLTVDLSGAFGEGDRTIGLNDCQSRIADTLIVTGNLTGDYENYTMRLLWSTGAACNRDVLASCDAFVSNAENTCGCLREESGVTSMNESTSIADFYAGVCDAATGNFQLRFYLEYRSEDDANMTVVSDPIVIDFDFDAPNAPTDAPTVTGVDGGLEVSFQGGGGDSYQVCYVSTGAERCSTTSDTSYRLTGLENGIAYTVYYRVIDEAGNASGNSPSTEGTPVESNDFAEFYSATNGQAKGCTARPGSTPPLHWLWALVPLMLLRRRRWLGVVALVVLLAPSAWARDVKQTPRSASFEFRMGSYLPNIDDEFGDQCGSINCPYATIFEDDNPLMMLFSYHRHLLLDAGTLSLGGGFGYWNADEGRAVRTAPDVSPVDFADDKTEISVYPLFFELGYKLDLFQDTVPLVPALRVGLDAYAWRIFDGEGEVTRFKDREGGNAGDAAGMSYGWHASLGVHILLDYFAPGMAADFDRDAGVNNSYLTIDYQISQISNFGGGETLWLGSEVLLIGIGLDM